MLSSVVEHILHTDGVAGSKPAACTSSIRLATRREVCRASLKVLGRPRFHHGVGCCDKSPQSAALRLGFLGRGRLRFEDHLGLRPLVAEPTTALGFVFAGQQDEQLD
jgi:hypothetical protein